MQRQKLKPEQILIVFFLLLGTTAFSVSIIQAKEKQENPPDVLIIYSSGTPIDYYSKGPLFKKMFKKFRDGSIREIDSVTTATPLEENCKTISGKLASVLREKGLEVMVVNATEIQHRSEILSARLVIIGTPSRFYNVTWELKKLFDEQFSKICAFEQNRLANLRIAAFAMAEVKPSANDALKAIKLVVNHCKGRFGPTMTFLVKHSKTEVAQRINRFAKQLSTLLIKP